jgi:hypothetical protein
VITTLEEPSQPQHSVTMTWNLSPDVDGATFSFSAPASAERIVIAERPADAAAAKN